MIAQAAGLLLMFVVLPVWIVAGFADYWCHRAAHIEDNAGTRESVLHLLQFGAIGLPTALALVLEINAGFFLLAALAIIFHHAVAFIDVRYANHSRSVAPIEQMVHSFLEIMPITAFLLLSILHWPQLLSLLGQGAEPADFGVHMKSHPLPLWYVGGAIGAAALLNAVPYVEEFVRCRWRAGGG
jgi:hypothetical protein